LRSDALPGAMAAFTYQDKIYFGSVIRAPAAVVKLANVPKGSIRDIIDDALINGASTSCSSRPTLCRYVSRLPTLAEESDG